MKLLDRLYIWLKKLTGSIYANKTSSAIYYGFAELSKRQLNLLNQVPYALSNTKCHKSKIKVSDLAALTAKTGDEFALFTRGSQRLLIRGESFGVPLTEKVLLSLKKQGYKWSAHSHPGTSDNVLDASGKPGDRLVLELFEQKRSLIVNSSGRRNVFDSNNNWRVDS
jgi:hypothetical protein